MYRGGKNRVKPAYQHSVMNDLLTGVGEQTPWCTLFADDIAQKGKILADLETKLKLLQQVLEPNGLWISREKREYMRYKWRSGRMGKFSSVGSH